jgi:NADH-quinone oxidoreductase subunit N
MNWADLVIGMMPEHLLLGGALVLITLDVIELRFPRWLVAAGAVAAAALVAAMLSVMLFRAAPFPGHYSVDAATFAAKAVVLALALPLVVMARDPFAEDGRFFILLLGSLYGVLLVTSSDNFLTLFLGLEIMSMPVYVLVLLAYQRPEAAEAALKYLVLGGAATAMVLMGASFLFGATGTLSLDAFTRVAQGGNALGTAATVLILLAFFLKAAIVPFHAWAPDAYEAASVPVTAYMSTLVKAGVLLGAWRVVGTAPLGDALVGMLIVLPLASMVWGNLAAMRQSNLRRMIAYSSIAHAGYLFFALLGDGPTRLTAIVFYLLAYGLMNLMAFAALPASADDAQRDRLASLRGLYGRQPAAALMIGVAMLSLAGIPPFPGFVAKFLIFKNVLAAGYTTVAVLGLLASYLGIYFYLRVIQALFMGAPQEAPPRGAIAVAAGVLCALPVALMTFFPGLFIAALGR